MVVDKVLERSAPGRRGVALVAALALFGAWLVVHATLQWRASEREQDRARQLQLTADLLISQTTGGSLLGAVALLGLSEPLLKDMANGALEPDNPAALARLGVARGRFLVEGVYVMSADGTVVAHETADARSTGLNLAFRPYFQEAIRGAVSVYAAIGSTSQERGLYYAAPLYASDTPSSAIIGVVMFKMGFGPIDELLRRSELQTVLLSPQGVVFAATRAEWHFAVAPPLTQARIDAIRATRQFGQRFDNGVASALPFSPDAAQVSINGVPYAVSRLDVGWQDPAGRWQLVALDDISALMTPVQRGLVGATSFVLLLVFGLLLLDMLRSRARVAEAQQRFKVLGAALQTSPVSVVITDGEGRIDWVNTQYEHNTGYTLEEVRGRKPSVVASGQTPPQAYQALWSSLLAGRSWQGHFVNRRKDGSIYHDEATLSPVLDERGRRIGIVGLHEDVTDRMRSQQELERRERLLNELLEQQTAIFDNAPPILLLCDGRFRQFNPAFVDLMRSTSAQLLGQDVSVLLGSAAQRSATLHAPMRAELQAGQAVRETATLWRQDGTTFEARLAGRGLKIDGCHTASIWVIEDVSEQQLAERAMQQARERLELAQEAGKVGVFDVDLARGKWYGATNSSPCWACPPGSSPHTTRRGLTICTRTTEQARLPDSQPRWRAR